MEKGMETEDVLKMGIGDALLIAGLGLVILPVFLMMGDFAYQHFAGSSLAAGLLSAFWFKWAYQLIMLVGFIIASIGVPFIFKREKRNLRFDPGAI